MRMMHFLKRALSAPLFLGILLGISGTALTAGMLGSSVFTDVPEGSYYDEAIGELYDAGIIRGYDATHFGPDDNVTRGQVAVMLNRLRDELLGNVEVSSSSSSRSRRSAESSDESSSSSTASAATSATPAGLLRFTTTAFSVYENIPRATISVVRAGGSQGQVTVEYATIAGTATAGTDFTSTSGMLTLASGETSKTFTVEIKDDTTAESSETVTVTLSNPTGGAQLTNPSSLTLTINDNETSNASSTAAGAVSSIPAAGALTFTANTYAVAENGGTITITVNRVGGSAGAVSVNYATSNGTAGSSDYNAANGKLDFAAGETSKTFTVSVIDDSTIDGNKGINLALSSPTGGSVLGTDKSASITIIDNESLSAGSGSLKLAKSSYQVSENDGSIAISILRTGGAQGSVSVNYATSNGTAVSGSDYTSTSGTVTFATGEAGKTIIVPVYKDDAADAEEIFYFTISSPTGGALIGSPSSTTVMIY